MFEYDEKIATCIAYKEIGKQVKVDKYYSHGFNKDKELKLENVNSVGDVYKNLLSYEIGIKFRKDEDPSDYITRVKAINKLEFQISKTEKAIQFETQPKKKFEYNERLRKYKADYNDLIIPALGHEYGDLITEVSATCESDGIKAHYECAVCGKYFDNF